MSQTKQIKHFLECGNKLTPLEALDKFGCMRLAAVIHVLKEQGCITNMIKNQNKTYAEYYLENPTGNKDQYRLFGEK